MDKLTQQAGELKRWAAEQMPQYDEIVHKTYSSGVFSKFHVEDGKREFIATITTNTVDRDGDVMDPKGADIKSFQSNPVIFLNHEAWEMPIGKAQWIRRFTEAGKAGLLSKGYISDKTERGKEAFGLMQDGILTTTSIGFGIKAGGAREPNEDETKKYPGIKRMVTKWELFEFSVVGIPANTDAIIQQVSKMSKVPDWLGVKVPEVALKQREPEPVTMVKPVRLQRPVQLTKKIKMQRKLTEQEIAQQASAEFVELFETRVLGRV